MRRFAFVLALAGCKGGSKTEKAAPADAGRGATPVAAVDAAAKGGGPDATPVAKAPAGTIAGKPFAPNVVILEDTSDGGKLGLYQVPANRMHRLRCMEPMGSSSEYEMTLYRPVEAWTTSAPVETELDGWSVPGVDWGKKVPGKAVITLTEKDAATFRIAGTIEVHADDGSWSLSGPFEGEYCPTKAVDREEGKTEPLAGMAWTRKLVSAEKLPATPVEAIIAGQPATIEHVTIREVTTYDGGEVRRQELTFFDTPPPEPCAERPRGGWSSTYSGDEFVGFEGPKYRADHFAVFLAAPPAAGARLAGNAQGGEEHGDQVTDVQEEVFEPDGTRSWMYSQYYSAAVAIDAVDDKEVHGRVYAAVPDGSQSMIVGAFTALRCPPLD